jgi:hypothetical protein
MKDYSDGAGNVSSQAASDAVHGVRLVIREPVDMCGTPVTPASSGEQGITLRTFRADCVVARPVVALLAAHPVAR